MRNWIYLFIPILTAMLIGGCQPITKFVKPTPTKVRNYVSGTTLKADIGDPIFSVSTAAQSPGYELVKDYTPQQGSIIYRDGEKQDTIPAGTKFGVTSITGGKYLEIGSADLEIVSTVLTDQKTISFSTSYVSASFNIDTAGYVLNGPGGVLLWKNEPMFQQSATPYIWPGSFNAELIYTGLIGNTLRAVYREYINDLARPAFSTELQYSLDESKIIAYRSIRIEVFRATNTQLEYKVLSDNELPWLPRYAPKRNHLSWW